MQIAVVLFEGFAALDAVGPHDALSRIPRVHATFVAQRLGPVRDDTGRLAIVADAELAEIPRPDVVVMPGGAGRRQHMSNGTLHQWLRAADATSRWTLGVGEGAVILAAAGPLRGRRVASPAGALSLELVSHGVVPVGDRFTVDGKYGTAADGQAGIQLAARLSHRMSGRHVAEHHAPNGGPK